MKKPVLAWHFLTEEYVPEEGIRKKPMYVGHLWRVKGPIGLCKRGLHGSILPLDALYYAPGPIVTRTAHSGTVIHGEDKLVSTRRKILGMADATTVLHEFACDVTEQIMQRADTTDEGCWAALEVKRRWIRGEATDEELMAAWWNAWDFSRHTFNAASWATDASAWTVAWSCAWAAERDLTWMELNADLESRFLRLLGMEEDHD